VVTGSGVDVQSGCRRTEAPSWAKAGCRVVTGSSSQDSTATESTNTLDSRHRANLAERPCMSVLLTDRMDVARRHHPQQSLRAVGGRWGTIACILR
jgi:hypothetical protein